MKYKLLIPDHLTHKAIDCGYDGTALDWESITNWLRMNHDIIISIGSSNLTDYQYNAVCYRPKDWFRASKHVGNNYETVRNEILADALNLVKDERETEL